jgi:hypothetical protein
MLFTCTLSARRPRDLVLRFNSQILFDVQFPDSVPRFRSQILSQATQNSPVLSLTGVAIGQIVTALRCQADMRQGGVH